MNPPRRWSLLEQGALADHDVLTHPPGTLGDTSMVGDERLTGNAGPLQPPAGGGPGTAGRRGLVQATALTDDFAGILILNLGVADTLGKPPQTRTEQRPDAADEAGEEQHECKVLDGGAQPQEDAAQP